MKKHILIQILIMLFTSFVLSSCADIATNKNSINATVLDDTVAINNSNLTENMPLGIEYWLNNTENVGNYQKDVIPDEDAAKAIATAIYQNMDIGDSIREYVIQSVWFDDDVWIVNFGLSSSDESETHYVGGGFSIAMQKTDGKVLRIWFGE